LEVSERTTYRDIADLMAQGAPIDGEAGVGYILRPGLFLPPLMLSEDEVEAVMLGLRYVDQRGDDVLQAAASVALTKISAVLSPQAQAQLTNPLSLPGPRPTFPQNAMPLNELRAAIRDRVRLDIRYGDEQERRTAASSGQFNSVSWIKREYCARGASCGRISAPSARIVLSR
jgi:predicted DNA-binding transcriptional regulator YafY